MKIHYINEQNNTVFIQIFVRKELEFTKNVSMYIQEINPGSLNYTGGLF